MLGPLEPETDGCLPATMVLLKGRECSLSFSIISLPLIPLNLPPGQTVVPTFHNFSL